MSFDERLEVPAAKSRASTSAVDRPRVAASNAAPAPVAPAPITTTSKTSFAIRSRAASRCSGFSSPRTSTRLVRLVHDPAPRALERAAPVGEQGLPLVVGQVRLVAAVLCPHVANVGLGPQLGGHAGQIGGAQRGGVGHLG